MSSVSVAAPLCVVNRSAPLHWGRLALIGAAWAVFALFLLLPIVFIVLLSFGSSQWLVFPPPGWTPC